MSAQPTDQPVAPGSAPPPPRGLAAVSLVLAVACGASVANLYYAQPLLGPIGAAFGVGQGAATTVVTATQVGYAVGLALLLPLGDLLENRRLASRTLVVTGAALAVAALAPSFGVFLAASVLVGTTSVVAQVLVPLAAHLAPADQRGRFVGRVMSGLLLGIMLARSVASFVAAAWGWRSIYAVSAALMVVVSLSLVRVLPQRRPPRGARYRELMASLVHLVRTEPVLRRRAAAQALLFGAFTAYWTAIAYELVDDHRFSQTGVAVFALVGAAGAASAPLAGRLGDAGHGRTGRLLALVAATGAMVLAHEGDRSVAALAVAGVVLDLSVQGHQVLCQRDVYALREDARARVNSVFATSIFVTGAAASAVTGIVHERSGWGGVTAVAAALPLLGTLLWVVERRRER